MKLLLGLMLSMGGLQGTQASLAPGIVNGRVTNATGTEGIPGLSVLLAGPLTGAAANAATSNPLMIEEIAQGSGTPTTRATTDGNGRVVFRNLAPGQYMLKVQQEGYRSAVPTPTGAMPTMATALTAVGTGPADVTISLFREAIVSGRVRDAAGQPLPGAIVGAYQLGYLEGRRFLMQVSSRQSNDQGDYRLFGLPPGRYYFAVAKTTTPTSGIPGPTGPFSWCCKTFYPGTLDVDSATPITLAEGAEMVGIDIDTRAPATFKISGRVIHAVPGSTNAIPNVFIVPVSGVLDRETSFQPGLSITPDGNFVLSGVPAGSYQMMATVSVKGLTHLGRVAVDVPWRDVDGVSLALSPGTDVRLRILVDGSAAAGTGLILQLRARDTWNVSPPTYSTGANAEGVFVFPGILPATYSVSVVRLPANSNSYVADVREGARSVYDSGLVITDQPVGLIDVLVNTGAPSIRGVVRNAEGSPAASVNVVLVPPPARRENAALYRTARTDSNGGFVLSGIEPGEYKVFAWEILPNAAYLNPAFIETYESRGRVVTITGDGNPSMDLTLIPAELP